MKKYIFAFIAILLLAVSACASPSLPTKATKVLNVADIQGDPTAYKGTITVTGVVAAQARDDPTLFALVDTAEAIICKTTGCASFYLPVRYEGTVPKMWDEVNITGSITKDGQFFIFIADKVKVLRHLTF